MRGQKGPLWGTDTLAGPAQVHQASLPLLGHTEGQSPSSPKEVWREPYARSALS